jgi:cell wall-associated NlpC family hydrolase
MKDEPEQKRAGIAAEALTWVGTPFRHQGSLKGVGVDCGNFIAGVALNCGLPKVVDWTNDYQRQTSSDVLEKLLTDGLDLLDGDAALRQGDVLAFHDGRQTRQPRHLAIVVEVSADGLIYIVHASERGVRRHRLSRQLRDLLHSAWALRLNDER